MAIPDIYFSPANDYHLLRGQSVNLLDMLWVSGTKATAYKTAHKTTSYTFKPLFLGTIAGTTFASVPLKLSVDTSTGVVQTTAGTPVNFKRNFIVEVTAEDSADPGKKQTTIRIHVHTHVKDAWLTPPLLTVRPLKAVKPELTRYRFSIRAEFDDGVVGDVTNHPGITYAPGANTSFDGSLALDVGNNPGTPPVTIIATLPANLESKKAQGQMQAAAPWSAEADIQTDIIPGAGWAGPLNPNDEKNVLFPPKAMNVLFLCDGYQDTDIDKFRSQTDKFVDLLKGSTITSPFNVLATSINFWRAFVPSPVRGTSFLCEMFIKEFGTLQAQPVPNPKKPPDDGNWTIENLIYAAGLPVSSDSGLSVADIKTQWTNLIDPLPLDRIDDDVIQAWKEISGRFLLEEQDSVLGYAYGDRPSSSGTSDSVETGFHPDRMRPDDFNAMLAKLKDLQNGVDITDVWKLKPDYSRSDHGVIMILTSAKWDRGVNYGSHIGLNVEERNEVKVSAVDAHNSFELDHGDFISPEILGIRMLRGTHEIGHSFMLGDEYNEQGTMDDAYNVDDSYANLQKSIDVKTGADINGQKIKWRWPRINKAAVMSGGITDTGSGGFRIPVVSGQGSQFKTGDTVLLRMRKAAEPLKKTTAVIAKELEIIDPIETDAVTVKGKGGAAVDIAELKAFPDGCIVFAPVGAPASVLSPTYLYAELIARNIMDHISARKRALNVDPASPQECLGDDRPIQSPVKLDIPLTVPVSKLPSIVGLYTGGALFNCGVYHPAGSCIMRNSNADGKEFCQVCRYVIVDMIDPYKHFEIDREYALVYPQK